MHCVVSALHNLGSLLLPYVCRDVCMCVWVGVHVRGCVCPEVRVFVREWAFESAGVCESGRVRECACVYLLLILLHEGELVLQLFQHLHLWRFETGPVGPQLIQQLVEQHENINIRYGTHTQPFTSTQDCRLGNRCDVVCLTHLKLLWFKIPAGNLLVDRAGSP